MDLYIRNNPLSIKHRIAKGKVVDRGGVFDKTSLPPAHNAGACAKFEFKALYKKMDLVGA